MSFDKTKCIKFELTALTGSNKVGILKTDEDGYIDGMSLGAINVFNSRGEFYVGDCQEVLDLFSDGSKFMAQVKDGRTKAENGHPVPMPNESYESFAIRWSRVNEPRVCAHHNRIYLGKSSVKTPNDLQIVPIYGRTRPSGELMYVLEEDLKRPEINVCFSLRGATQDDLRAGINYKYIREIYTFDKVNDPGINVAKRWNSIALESEGRLLIPSDTTTMQTITADAEMLQRINSRMSNSRFAAESAGTLMDVGDLMRHLGYRHNVDMNSARGWRGWLNDKVR